MGLVLQATASVAVAAGRDSVWAGTAINLFMEKGTQSVVWARQKLLFRAGERIVREAVMSG